jgi:fatty acid CoA ligase FadD9
MAGDVSLPHFGLEPRTWEALCETVDTIHHIAALVNHAFTYQQLFVPNVLGTVEVRATDSTTRYNLGWAMVGKSLV